MKVLHCSDFHANPRWLEWLVTTSSAYELVCITGDLLDSDDPTRRLEQLDQAVAALQRVSGPKALCSGNHDGTGEWMREHWTRFARIGCRIDGETFHLGGFTFRCLGWQALLPYAESDREIWLTHAPPSGTKTSVDRRGRCFGDQILEDILKQGKGPRLVLCGHIHDPQSWCAKVGRTLVVNPGFSWDSPRQNHADIDLQDAEVRYGQLRQKF